VFKFLDVLKLTEEQRLRSVLIYTSKIDEKSEGLASTTGLLLTHQNDDHFQIFQF
jgi:hypothetical protein